MPLASTEVLSEGARNESVATLTITGYEPDVHCEHCGRPLKIGIRVAEKGVIGADCFVRMVKFDRKRFSGNGKPSAEMVRQYAIIVSKGLAYAASRYGYSARTFLFQEALPK